MHFDPMFMTLWHPPNHTNSDQGRPKSASITAIGSSAGRSKPRTEPPPSVLQILQMEIEQAAHVYEGPAALQKAEHSASVSKSKIPTVCFCRADKCPANYCGAHEVAKLPGCGWVAADVFSPMTSVLEPSSVSSVPLCGVRPSPGI